jgi:hypothetical protein
MIQCSLENAYSFSGTDNLKGSSEAFTGVLFRVLVIWDVMMHHLVNGTRHFEGILGVIHRTHHHIPNDQNTHAACSTPFRWKQNIILNRQ